MKAFLHQNFEEGVYKMLVGVKIVWPFANNLPIYIFCAISIAVLKMVYFSFVWLHSSILSHITCFLYWGEYHVYTWTHEKQNVMLFLHMLLEI